MLFPIHLNDEIRLQIELRCLVASHVVILSKTTWARWKRERVDTQVRWVDQREKVRVVLDHGQAIADPLNARCGAHVRRPILKCIWAILVPERHSSENLNAQGRIFDRY